MKILFIGNSHTYYHGMPYQCRALLAALGVDAQVSLVVAGGKSLAWHQSNPETRLALRYDTWDQVILQQATHPFAGTTALRDGVLGLQHHMPGNQSVRLYKTWCAKDIPRDQIAIDTAFAAVSAERGLPIIPVADVWHAVERQAPGHNLYDTDGKHAGRSGSYLTALCMTRALAGRSVQGLPATLQHKDRTINRVAPTDASRYQAVVDEWIKT